MATWEDIERAALDCPHLYALVTHVRMGADREEALLAAVLGLSSANRETARLAADVLANGPPPLLLIGPERRAARAAEGQP
jgi:hypothetical protein